MDGFASPAALPEGVGGGCRSDQLPDGRRKLRAAHLSNHLEDSQLKQLMSVAIWQVMCLFLVVSMALANYRGR